jgi:hypothetical protein
VGVRGCLQPGEDRAALSLALIEDTLSAMPVPPQAVSHLQGPSLQMRYVSHLPAWVWSGYCQGTVRVQSGYSQVQKGWVLGAGLGGSLAA